MSSFNGDIHRLGTSLGILSFSLFLVSRKKLQKTEVPQIGRFRTCHCDLHFPSQSPDAEASSLGETSSFIEVEFVL
ncbi:unnamed protein product [Cyprideis torosa]|uniref:Uncharacterized protein n=1 Tax=Cyprideis torosa TaxID=163714 RepID=A0A7R8WS35_9CRUS|nr:unnamed protein product [Cyprideis torosa]CAG0903296.1 unnamed protein product [Cyprideis torosa]